MNDPAHTTKLSRNEGPYIQAILEENTGHFVTLARLAGFDPASDFRFHNWSGVNFRDCDLQGYDFSGSRLVNCDFTGAKILGARFDQAEIAGTNFHTAADWPAYVQNWQPIGDRRRSNGALRPWIVFQDAPFAPELMVVPSRLCSAGVPCDQPLSDQPKAAGRKLHVPALFAVSCSVVSAWEFSGYRKKKEFPRKDKNNPARATWSEVQEYISWLNQRTGIGNYRLLSEAEWEYCIQAEYPTEHAPREVRRRWGYSPSLPRIWKPAGEWLADEWHETFWDRPESLDVTAAARVTSDRSTSRVVKTLRTPNEHVPSSEKWYNVIGRTKGRVASNLTGRDSHFFRVARNLSS